MATLVLSTVGNALGGPVGGAIGALIGQSIDQQLLGPSRGPGMGDLKVQSSSYGTQIPRVYGAMRVAGTIVWATDLVESSEMTGVKGQPDTTYSYAVSFAVALSSRKVARIGRIWADGKLLRGEAGDFKVSTTFRFYDGGEDQEVDPLIASVEGLESTLAYRGLALCVFENLKLAEYGNRIPFLTFEVFGDDGAVAFGDVLGDVSSRIVACDADQAVAGYAAYGQSMKAAIQPLVDCYAVELFDDGSRLVSPVGEARAVGDAELGNSSDGEKAARIEREQAPARSLPSALRLGYYDPALDYQAGEARASSAERSGTEVQRELPAAVSAGEAKSLAQSMIARAWTQRDRLTLRLPPDYLDLQPGTRVEIDLSPRLWCVEQCTIDGFVVIAELRPSWGASTLIAADAGRIVPNSDVVTADVALALFDVPDVLGIASEAPMVLLAASSPSSGWKSCAAEIIAGQQSLQVQTAARKSVLGAAMTLLGTGDPYLINRGAAFDIELIDADQWLLSCDDEALGNGANLAVLGSELIQFGSAEPLGDGRYRLSRLLRGRGGTEWAMGGHSVEEAYAMIERDRLRPVPLAAWALGAGVTATVRNLSGTTSGSDAIVLQGENLRPRSPVRVKPSIDESGDLLIAWTRRTRAASAWVDEVDVPLGERVEFYRVSVAGIGGSLELEAAQPSLRVAAAQVAELGPGAMTIEVRQVGDFAASRAAECSITI
jgi:hypothetical protein